MFRSMTHRFVLIALVALAMLLSACAAGQPTPMAMEAPATPPTATTAPATDTPASAAGLAGAYKGFFPGASSPGLDATLYLNADGTLRLVNDYLNEEPPVVEVGAWQADDGALTLTITGMVGQAYEKPVTYQLAVDGDRLVASQWIGPWWRFDALALGTLPPYDTAMAAAAFTAGDYTAYYKAFAPAASCCGQDITLLLGIDTLARLQTDYLNGEAPIVEVGTWAVKSDGRISVALTGPKDGPVYAKPAAFFLEAKDNLLRLVPSDEDGSAVALNFYLYPALAMAGIQAGQ